LATVRLSVTPWHSSLRRDGHRGDPRVHSRARAARQVLSACHRGGRGRRRGQRDFHSKSAVICRRRSTVKRVTSGRA
jgi:hypothetical protein